MTRFKIEDDFCLDGKPFKILSGAIHYFRIPEEDWYHSLYNLKALGFNTVETYVAWNLHEPTEGNFNFEGNLNIDKFLQTAQDLGLYAIVRPSPFICAEWEFGGLPAWLLNKDMRIRSSDPAYVEMVGHYYDHLLPRLVSRLLDNGGNILMMQVENEYGSYGEDKTYLREIRRLMEERSVTCPLFTSDGPWRATLKAGTLIEDDLFVTGNFGSKANFNFSQMQEFFDEYGKKWPLMCMEFWDGWFNRWKEPVITRDAEELAEAVHEVLEQGSINLYMFHGGTNFGFMNGCSARGTIDLPQVTSYDYDALLNEAGNPTAKYMAVKEMMATYYPEYPQLEPLYKESMEVENIPLVEKVSLFETLDSLTSPTESLYPKKMEELGQSYGYLLYRTEASWDAEEERIRIIDGRDRAQLFVDGKWVATQYQTEIGEDIFYQGEKKALSRFDILIENMGRVNYGHKLLADTQRKGIRTGVCKDLHFMLNWEHYPLPLDNPEKIDFSKGWTEGQPAFYAYDFEVKESKDTYLELSEFGKGIAYVNGRNLGRFWNVGPTLSLYIPHSYLKEGANRIIIFETEGDYKEHIHLIRKPTLKHIKGENL
ncbi:glycoside hydrolase family 35 protein [Streptococcus sp. KHUD_014]|uniref:glycoside hydrolase family 35 protein n=1 Tax=Streptococcus sp. KHUD_014 TaxID=3434353 RepID=UPI003DA1D54D